MSILIAHQTHYCKVTKPFITIDHSMKTNQPENIYNRVKQRYIDESKQCIGQTHINDYECIDVNKFHVDQANL